MSTSITNIVEIIIWINLFLLLNVYFFYPMFIYLASKIFDKPINNKDTYFPDITIIMAAYNEEKLIGDAIHSIYNSGYPIDKIRVIVGCDGCTDNTAGVLKLLSDSYKTLEYCELERSGKNVTLNTIGSKVTTPVFFYMDADLRIVPGTIERMIKILSDENVGSVLAAIKIIGVNSSETSGGIGETIYQKYEEITRLSESKIHSNINSLGTLYALKTELYNPIPNVFAMDDLYRILSTALQKKRIIFDDKSVVMELREKASSEEFTRRIRMVAGGLSAVKACKGLLSPGFGWVSYFVWNHKVLRWFSPLYLILIFTGTLLLINTDSIIYKPLLFMQILLYFGAFLGWLIEKSKFKIVPLKVIFFFVSMNIGFLLGLFRFVNKEQNSLWGRGVNN